MKISPAWIPSLSTGRCINQELNGNKFCSHNNLAYCEAGSFGQIVERPLLKFVSSHTFYLEDHDESDRIYDKDEDAVDWAGVARKNHQ